MSDISKDGPVQRSFEQKQRTLEVYKIWKHLLRCQEIISSPRTQEHKISFPAKAQRVDSF